MNAVTQATNGAEEQPAAGSQGQAPAAIQRGSGSAAPRRRWFLFSVSFNLSFYFFVIIGYWLLVSSEADVIHNAS